MGAFLNMTPWRVGVIERGSPLKIEEFANLIKVLGDLAFYKSEPKIKIKFDGHNAE